KINKHSNYRVEENAEIMFEDLPYRFKGSEELEQGASVIIKAGAIFSEITTHADIPTLKVKTKSTAMAVRGTVFMASVDAQTDDVYLAVNRGVVEVENDVSGMRDAVG